MTWLANNYKTLLLALFIAIFMHFCGKGGELPGNCTMIGSGVQAYEVCR